MSDSMTTLLGGEDLVARKLDGSEETVTIRQLPVRMFPQLLAALEDEPRMVELYCDRPPGWANELTTESHEALIAAGERLNSDFFGRWVQRHLARQERVMPGITERLLAARGMTLPAGSPSSPSSAG